MIIILGVPIFRIFTVPFILRMYTVHMYNFILEDLRIS